MNNKTFTIVSILSVSLIITGLVYIASSDDIPNRENHVGRLHLALSDSARRSWSGDGPRPLATTVWYPTSAANPEQTWSAGVFRFGYSALNAPFDDTTPRPLIVLSHGTGGSAAQLSWLAEHLVAGGYIVAAVNHHGNTALEDRQWPAAYVLPSERSRDLSVLIDKLLNHAELGPRIDRNRIGAAGFSLGGYSVFGLAGIQLPSFDVWEQRCSYRMDLSACQLPPEAEFGLEDIDRIKASDPIFLSSVERARESVQDRRIGAVYAIAPALISLIEEADLSIDVLADVKVILAEQDEQITFSETSHVLDQILPQAEARVIERATHYMFLSPCSIRGKLFLRSLCSDPVGINRRDVHAKVGKDAVDFFDSILLSEEL